MRRWLTCIAALLFSGLLTFFPAKARQTEGAINQFIQSYDSARARGIEQAYTFTRAFLAKNSSSPVKEIALHFQANLSFAMGNLAAADSLFRLAHPPLADYQLHKYVLKNYRDHANVLRSMGQLVEGLTLMQEAQKFIDENESLLNTDELQILIGSLYRNTGIFYAIQAETDQPLNYDFAEKYFRKAYRAFVAGNDQEGAGMALFNIGNVKYTEDSTLYYWQQALDIFVEHGIERQKANVNQNMAILYIDKGEYTKGLQYLNETQRLVGDLADPYTISLLKIKYGKAYLGLNRLSNSIKHLEEGLRTAEAQQMTSLQGEAYELLIQAYSQQGQFAKALDIYVQYDTLLNQLDRLETERIYRETEARYKTREQADKIRLLEQEDALNQARLEQQRLVIVIVIIVLISIGLLSYFLWKRGTERKQLNEQLRKLNQARTRFLVNISHELRTPLTLLHAPLEDAIEQLEQGKLDRVKNDLTKIGNNTKKLLQLTEEVLDISKLDEGALRLEHTAVKLDKFLNRVFFAFESLAVRHGIKWEAHIEIPDQAFDVDAKKLEKIINNLLSNAIKHTPKGEMVRFEARLAGDHLYVKVADTGRGISEEKLPHIFNRYYQADGKDQQQGGLGIGLAFVKELLDFMEGEISVESTPDKGSTFTVKLPVTFSDKQPVAEDIEATPAINIENRPSLDLSSNEQPHILVVEDNPEMSDFIQQLLSDQFRVTVADNGKEGIERLRSASFDLVTADVMMPEMDGISFVKDLKAHSSWQHLPVIMITALSEETDKVAGLRLGIDDYIPKPFNAGELKARVYNLLRNAENRRQGVAEMDNEAIANEQQILITAREAVEANLDKNDFGVKDLAEHLNLSERQANRVLKKITGLSSLQFIREIKLQKAYKLLEARKYATIAEVSYAVGFENHSYFARLFSERFGKKPSELL